MTSANLLPLVLLYTDARDSVDGATRIQKLIFIAQEEAEIVPEVYPYHADRYGPYSPDLEAGLDRLEKGGLIERDYVRNEVGNPKVIYSMTQDGIAEVRRMLEADSADALFSAVEDIKKKHNGQRLSQLLRYVYGKYEEYTTETELDLDRLFDPDAESQFTEKETDFLGPGPDAFRHQNPSAEEFFSVETEN